MGRKEYLLTEEKLEELKTELKELETVKAKELDERLVSVQQEIIGEFESPFYNLSEDKFYLEKRIEELKDIINNSKIIEKGKEYQAVEIGSTVTVGIHTGQETYTVVTPLEANPLEGKISNESPVGKALIEKKVGDKVEVQIGGIKKELRIIKIK